jgi:hypothetical protein
MHHPPNEQIDNFGVWALELDYSIVIKEGTEHAVVGHDSDDDKVTCWGRELRDFLQLINQSDSLHYRPVFIYFEKKDWGARVFNELEVLESELRQVFSEEHIFSHVNLREFEARYNRHPTVPELAGKVIPVLLGAHPASAFFFNDGRGPDSINFNASSEDHCTNWGEIQRLIQAGNSVFRLDQYQADWTFEYGVSPNPLIVDSTASLEQTLGISEQPLGPSDMPCDGAVSSQIHEQGTFRFPYKTVSEAIARAKGITSTGGPDDRRTGYGSTFLIRPGNYPETLTIDIPLILKKDDRFTGTVVIGR